MNRICTCFALAVIVAIIVFSSEAVCQEVFVSNSLLAVLNGCNQDDVYGLTYVNGTYDVDFYYTTYAEAALFDGNLNCLDWNSGGWNGGKLWVDVFAEVSPCETVTLESQTYVSPRFESYCDELYDPCDYYAYTSENISEWDSYDFTSPGGGICSPDGWYYLGVVASELATPQCDCAGTPFERLEWYGAIQWRFPFMIWCHTTKDGPMDDFFYNCLAYAMGHPEAGIPWLEADTDPQDGWVSATEMTEYLNNSLYYPPHGSIAYYGWQRPGRPNVYELQHVAKMNAGHGINCAAGSKIGPSYLMSHDLAEMDGGVYGWRCGGY